VTTIRMDAGMDTGPILLQTTEPIRPNDDAGELGDRLAMLGGRLLVDTLEGLEAGTIADRAQDASQATTAPKLSAVDQQIRWDRPGIDIDRQVRALAPDPGAVTLYRGRVLKVFKVVKAMRAPIAPDEVDEDEPGAITAASHRWLVVATADQWYVALEEVQPEGKRRMAGAEFVRGYRPVPGERLG